MHRFAFAGSIEFDFGTMANNVFFDDAPSGAAANITTPSFDTSVSRTFTGKGRHVNSCHLNRGTRGVVVVQ